jgi:integrase
MKQTRKKIARHLHEVSWRTSVGDISRYYYAVFRCRLKHKDRNIPLGADLATAKDQLKRIEAKNVDRYDFDLDKQRIQEKPKDGKAAPFTFAEWCDKYPTFDDVKRKRSLSDDLGGIRLHLKPFFGAGSLTEIERESLTRYIDHRSAQTIIRNKNGGSKKAVSRGTISNELSLLRRMLRVAAREGFKVNVPSFDDLIVRTERGGRALTDTEQKAALELYPRWMQRIAEFAVETCLSQGDILRLTEDMIDWQRGVIVPTGGRKKTGVFQVSPLSQPARDILMEIKAEKKSGRVITNLTGLIFTQEDGRPFNRGHLQAQIKKAVRSGVKKFKFHDYRNTALTQWRRRGISVDAVMRAGGWSSVQMYKRYLDMNEDDIAAAFGTTDSSQIDKRIDKQNRVARHK